MKYAHSLFFSFLLFFVMATNQASAAPAFLAQKAFPVPFDLIDALAPHKALYRIELKSSKSGSQILDISGEMYYAWEATCEGWTTDHRFKLLYEYADTSPVEVKSDFTTFENYAGTKLDFSSRRKRNNRVFEEFRGQADLESAQSGVVTYTIPSDMSHDLTPNTHLPVAHTLKLLEKAQGKRRFFNAVLFDGSDEAGAYEVNAFIGQAGKVGVAEKSAGIDTNLLQTSYWPVRLAFFPTSQKSPAPEYEMQLNLHKNGVVSQMFVDYEDFAVTQKLVALEALGWPDCS